MSRFTRSSKRNPCPVCGRGAPDNEKKDGDCSFKEQENLVLCHTYIYDPGHPINEYVYRRQSDDGLWGVFTWDKRDDQGKLSGKKIRTSRKEQEYFYNDRQNNPFVKAKRYFRPGEEGKKFSQSHWDGSKWQDTLPDRVKADIPIYRYSEVRQAIDNGERIFIVEGENKADALWSIGIPATSFIGGSSKYKSYGLHYKDDLAGAKVVLCPDRDKSGLAHMDIVAKDFPDCEWVRVFPQSPIWAAIPDHKGLDIEDWIKEGATKEEIEATISSTLFAQQSKASSHDKQSYTSLIGRAKRIEEEHGFSTSRYDYELSRLAAEHKLSRNAVESMYLKAVCESFECSLKPLRDFLSEAELKEREWFVADLLPKGSTVLFYGDGGDGKTLFVYDLLRSIYDKETFLNKPVVNMPRTLLIQTDEPEDDLRERLNGSFLENSEAFSQMSLTTTWTFGSVNWLRSEILKHGFELIVIDSFASANRNALTEEKDAMHAKVLYNLRDIAQEMKCTFIVLHHTNKRGQSRGSTAMRNNVSECWHIRRYNPELDPVPLVSNERIFRVEKSRSGVTQNLVVAIQEDGNYEFVASLDDISQGKEQRPATWAEKMMAYFEANPQAEVTSMDLAAAPLLRGLKQDTAKKVLQRLSKKGLILKTGITKNLNGGHDLPIYRKNNKTLSRCPDVGLNAYPASIPHRDNHRDSIGTASGQGIGTGDYAQENTCPDAVNFCPDVVPMPCPDVELIGGMDLSSTSGQRDTDIDTRARNPLLERIEKGTKIDQSAKPTNPYTGPKLGQRVRFSAEKLSFNEVKKLQRDAKELPWGSKGTVVEVDYTTKKYFVAVQTDEGHRFQVENFLALEIVEEAA